MFKHARNLEFERRRGCATRCRSCATSAWGCRTRRRAGHRRVARIRLPPPAPVAILAGLFRARSSAVEHYLDMVGVTGSIPVAPTTMVRTTHPARPTRSPCPSSPCLTAASAPTPKPSRSRRSPRTSARAGQGGAGGQGRRQARRHLLSDRPRRAARDRHGPRSRRARGHPPFHRAPAGAGGEAAVSRTRRSRSAR